MKASELIAELQELVDSNKDVTIVSYDGSYTVDIEKVTFHQDKEEAYITLE